MYNLQLFNEIDDIDHFTLAVRKGKPFNREKAIWLLRRYCSYYPYVENVLRQTGTYFTFHTLSDRELYDLLITTREQMVKHTFDSDTEGFGAEAK